MQCLVPCGIPSLEWIFRCCMTRRMVILSVVNSHNNLPLNSYILDAACSDYGNDLAFKQIYTSLHGM